jgi:type IV pilus assembly protein PilY1
VAILWICASSRAALAQVPSGVVEPDVRSTPPFVMLIVDSSGSMEWRPDCACTTSACTECEPDCSLSNDAMGEPPAAKKNRWAVLLETLTGKFVDFQCVSLDRTAANGMTYDVNYQKPYHRPWVCPDGSALCTFPGDAPTPIQVQNGLIDNYNMRVRFGLMTFDGMRTYIGGSDLVPAKDFSTTLSNGAEGSYSYGGGKVVHYPTCTTDYMIDSGVRSASAPEGGMISFNSDKCLNPPCDQYELNDAIQTSLLNTRTYGGTPTAAALDDLYSHLKNEVTDTMSSCRDRYAVLITDGQADDDFRKYPVPGCNCKEEGTCPANEDPNAMHCPYPAPEQAAYNLKHGVGGDDPQIKQLFVIGMSLGGDAEARQNLNLIASMGGSTDDDKDGNEAYFADNPGTLTASLDKVLGSLSKPISRSVPAFATGLGGAQYQVSAGFEIDSGTATAGFAPPWLGIIERRRFVCSGSTLDSPDVDPATDRFDLLLNSQSARSLWTVLPTNLDSFDPNKLMSRGDAAKACGVAGCDRVELTSIDKAQFNVPDDVTKKAVVDWMYGNAGSVRAGKKLGDIYHSSPTIVGPPVDDPGDPSYSLFRESALIGERPLILYIGSNDGILHAFSMEDYPVQGGTQPTVHAGLTYHGGQELWGFVPPNLLDDLGGQLTAHKLSMDGTPVVKDVFFSKGTAPSPTDYHTVLITGMRGGGNAYVALDVTDPVVPKFLWQFTDDDMGLTYGQPEIVQAYYQWPAGQPAALRAMAILPGGKGTKGAGPGCGTVTTPAMKVPSSPGTSFTTLQDPDNTNSNAIRHRSDVQCWNRKGRALYFVDVETGQLIKKIFDDDDTLTNGTIFPSPLTGSPTAYPDAIGTVATEGFVMDADGVLWRIDLTDSDPHKDDALQGWTVRPFHDLFWDRAPDDDETSYERPILSLDDKRRLVIIAATGDTDTFDKSTVKNKIVSLTELTTSSTPTGPSDYVAAINWELVPRTDNGFLPSELVTGQMSLFQSELFAASFISVADATDPCSFGRGRLWSFDYTKRDVNDANPASTAANSGGIHTYGPTRIDVVDSDDNALGSGANLFNVAVAAAEPNLLIQGLGTTQRPTCVQADTTDLGNYYSPTSMVPIAQQTKPAIWIVAQASTPNSSHNRAASALNSLEIKIDRPQALTRVTSWAGSIE